MAFRILYVEDDESSFVILRDAMAMIFGKSVELVWVPSFKVLLELQNYRNHFLILDKFFPSWDAHIKDSLTAFPDLPTVLYTADTVEQKPGLQYTKDTEGRVMMINYIWKLVLRHGGGCDVGLNR